MSWNVCLRLLCADYSYMVYFVRCLGAGACGAGSQPTAEGSGGWEAADFGEGSTSRRQHQQSHRQHADGQQQVGLKIICYMCCLVYCYDHLFTFNGHERLDNCSILSPQTEKECRVSPSHGGRSVRRQLTDPPRSMTAKRYEALQHIAALIWLFSIYQTEPIYRALFKWDAQSALMEGEKKWKIKVAVAFIPLPLPPSEIIPSF